jgi:hypothetical protein
LIPRLREDQAETRSEEDPDRLLNGERGVIQLVVEGLMVVCSAFRCADGRVGSWARLSRVWMTVVVWPDKTGDNCSPTQAVRWGWVSPKTEVPVKGKVTCLNRTGGFCY